MTLVIRPFGLQDVLLVRKLQRSGTPLAIEHDLTHPATPLRAALSAPWAGMSVATYVLRERHQGVGSEAGFIQLVRRSNRPEADLLHIAAAPPSGAAVWCRLLEYCGRVASSHGLQRIFASVPNTSGVQECLRGVGFGPYTREVIYRLASCPPEEDTLSGFRRQAPRDAWALQRFYSRGTPRLVQQAEGALVSPAGWPALSSWDADRWHGLVWEQAGDIRGAVHLHCGRTGHWLRFWRAPGLTDGEAQGLVGQGLAFLSATVGPAGRRLPVYASVRDYEAGLSGVLAGFEFAPVAERIRLVKHTTTALWESASVAQGSLDTRMEVPARSQVNTLRRSWSPPGAGSRGSIGSGDATTTNHG